MIARRLNALAAVGLLALAAAACEDVPLLAPTGSTITLTASTNVLPVNSSTDIIANVLEAAGTPPHSGTVVSFTTTLGSIEPADARTDSAGRVIVKFRSGPSNGTAVINATSGGATTAGGTTSGGANGGTTTTTSGAVRISIGTAAVGRVSVNASPATVPNTGGSTTVVANVFDINGNALPSSPVSFTTTAGTLSTTLATTGPDGAASTILTTSQPATVTASVGATAPSTGGGGGNAGGGANGGGGTTTPPASGQASGSVTVNITVAPTLVITPPTTPPSVGLPANFTFVVTPAASNGSAIRNLRVDWGDGSTRDLGAISGTSVQSHVYANDGTYVLTATVTDAAGNSNTVSASVTVIPVGPPTIIITPSVPATGGATTTRVTFTIQVTPPTGVIITSAAIAFGDGQGQTLGGLTGTTTVVHDYDLAHRGPNTVTVTVVDSLGRTTTVQTTINVP